MRGDHEPETRHNESDGCSCLATQHNKGEGRTQQSSANRHSRDEGIEGSSVRKSPKIGNLLVAVFRVGKKIQFISNLEFSGLAVKYEVYLPVILLSFTRQTAACSSGRLGILFKNRK